jgi:phosphatidylserine/phosphatidylglycerophosphate/cardiolipin synthase-like enzyme
VVLAGYSFDHAREVLAPLHASMRDHGVEARFFVDVPQIRFGHDAAKHLRDTLGQFFATNWPFGDPRPRLYYDRRALRPGPPYCSLHAKCVVVDGLRSFLSSANFTQRGQERNVEVGVLIEDQNFATYLAGQWLGLIEHGIVGEYGG